MPEKDMNGGPANPARHVGRVDFATAGVRGRYRADIPRIGEGGVRLLIRFEGETYPFEQHYRYVRHRAGTYTFPNMEFGERPPGLMVGPWPGWRGIPPFPSVSLSAGGENFPVALTPWGDELTGRFIRGTASMARLPGGEMICDVADDRLRPVYADIYTCRFLHARPRQVELIKSISGTHPRLLITKSDLPELGRRASGSHAALWGRVNSLLESYDLPWKATPESKIPDGPERLRAEDGALLGALAALVDPTGPRSAFAKKSFARFMHETQQTGYEPLTIDTQAGETLFLLSVCFDWTHGLWHEEEREEIGAWIRHVAEICRSYLGYERRDYAQAHYLGCATGLLAFSLLFWEDHPRAREWAGHCRGALEEVASMLPRDGFYPHGVNLWIYEFGFLLRSLELLRVCTGTDLWQIPDIWDHASRFRGAATSPDGLCGVTFGDPQYRVGGDSWCHHLIAARTGSPRAQGLGNALLDIPPGGVDFRSAPPRRRVYEFLFYDDHVPSEAAEDGAEIFPDGGQVFLRNGGRGGTLFTFRAGPPLGQRRYDAGEAGGYGHADPGNGSFLLFSATGPVITGPGPSYRRDTSLHNTITIDGRGQLGDSAVWLPDFLPPDRLCPAARITVNRGILTISAEISAAYLPHIGVRVCRREIRVLPGRWIVGADTVECTTEHALEWNIHAPRILHLRGSGGGGLSCTLGSESSQCSLFMLNHATAECGPSEMVPGYTNDGTRFEHLRVSARAAETRFIWCILLDSRASTPAYDAHAHSVRLPGGPTLRVQGPDLIVEDWDDHHT